MIVAVLDTEANRLAYSVAGHLPLPVLVSGEGATYLEGEGSPVGMLKDAEFSEHSLDLPQEFLLALFSDGILEILPPQGLIEKERYFLDIFSGGDRSSAALMARLGLDTVKTALDDIAALFVSRKV
jgi:serine phosphatase RsbU (regulator of sigma subunit)